MTISAWRSAKWCGASFQPSAPKKYGPPMSSASASAHSPPCSAPSANEAPTSRPDADRRADRQPDDRLAKRRVVAAGEHEQRDVRDPHDGVGEREDQRGVVERLGHAQPDDEQRRHRGEDHEPDGVLLGIDDARQPGVADPRPPQHAEHEHALRQALPRRLVGHQRRALRQREHEDEVEEQLQRRDRLLLAHHRASARRARPVAASVLMRARSWQRARRSPTRVAAVTRRSRTPDMGRLLVSCPDQPGHHRRRLAASCFEHGANIVESDQYSTDPEGGTFFLRTVFHRAGLAALRDELERALRGRGRRAVRHGVDVRRRRRAQARGDHGQPLRPLPARPAVARAPRRARPRRRARDLQPRRPRRRRARVRRARTSTSRSRATRSPRPSAASSSCWPATSTSS